MLRFSRLRARLDAAMPKASMSVATLALVVAATGGVAAYAGAQIGTADIKNNAVTSAKIKKGNVTTADLSPKTRTRSWVWQPGAALQTTWPASGVVDLGTKKINVPAPGLLEINGFAVPSGGDAFQVVLALVDFKGSISDAIEGGNVAETIRLYDSFAMITGGLSGGGPQLTIPQRVSAGQHTIRWVALNSSATPGNAAVIALRKLTAEYQPGITGTEQKWTVPVPRQAHRLRALLR